MAKHGHKSLPDRRSNIFETPVIRVAALVKAGHLSKSNAYHGLRLGNRLTHKEAIEVLEGTT